MSQHTLKYIHNKEDTAKEHSKKKLTKKLKKKWKKEVAKQPPKHKPIKTTTTITDDIANTEIKENPDTVTNHLRHERVMKAQRKQMNARPLLNNAS